MQYPENFKFLIIIRVGIVADRLSEAGKSVMLVERGPPSTFKSGGSKLSICSILIQVPKYIAKYRSSTNIFRE